MDVETTKAIVRRYFEKLLNERDVSVCDELLTAAAEAPCVGRQSIERHAR